MDVVCWPSLAKFQKVLTFFNFFQNNEISYNFGILLWKLVWPTVKKKVLLTSNIFFRSLFYRVLEAGWRTLAMIVSGFFLAKSIKMENLGVNQIQCFIFTFTNFCNNDFLFILGNSFDPSETISYGYFSSLLGLKFETWVS